MFLIVFVLLIDICAFFFIGYGFFVLTQKRTCSYILSKPIKDINQIKIKQYNRAISFLYILTGLCFFIVGIVATNINIRISAILLIIVVVAIIPTLSSIQNMFINPQFKK